MRVQPSTDQGNNKQDAFSRRRSPLPTILIALNTLVIGGCLALLIVSQMLRSQNDVYISNQSMAAASAIIDFMDDLLAVYVLCASLMLLLFTGSAALWAWRRTQSRFLRYGSLILLLFTVILIMAVWFSGAATSPVPLQ
jgi:Na+/alanine symporter